MLLLGLAYGAEAGEDLLLGVVADTARVEKDDIGTGHIVDRFVPSRAELAHDQLAIEHVHLATHRFEVNGPLFHVASP